MDFKWYLALIMYVMGMTVWIWVLKRLFLGYVSRITGTFISPRYPYTNSNSVPAAWCLLITFFSWNAFFLNLIFL